MAGFRQKVLEFPGGRGGGLSILRVRHGAPSGNSTKESNLDAVEAFAVPTVSTRVSH
jgi:hypothetical protein